MSARFTRFTCPKDDGSEAHVEVRVRMPLTLTAVVVVFKVLAPLRCGCGSELSVPESSPGRRKRAPSRKPKGGAA